MITVGTVIALNYFKSEVIASESGMREVVESIVTIYTITDEQNPNGNPASGTDTTPDVEPWGSIAAAFTRWAEDMLIAFGVSSLPVGAGGLAQNPQINYTEVPDNFVMTSMTVVATDSSGAVVPGAVIIPATGGVGATIVLPHGQNITVTVTFAYGPPED